MAQPPPVDAKPRPLKRMFENVPARYDLLNRLLTLRFDERWRALAARELLAYKPRRVLDLCCGTADLALQIADQALTAAECSGEQVWVTGLDYSAGMLTLARRKARQQGAGSCVDFVEGDAAALPFEAASFDAVGIAYAFRNLTWHNPLKDAALAEVLRVLRPGGRFVIVETSQPDNAALRWLFHSYLRLVTAPLGGLISGHREAYNYLALSARKFYSPGEVSEMLFQAGFAGVSTCQLLGGVAALHVAVKAGG